MRQQTTLSDELTMRLVEQALAQPDGEREVYVRNACGGDPALFGRVWDYLQWEKRMAGFLLDPLYPPAEPERPFEPGQLLLNRFRIVREIAHGGMGIVWEAFDQRLERRIAIKCAKPGFAQQLPPELRHAREISHPNVCKFFEIHTASLPRGDVDFICMEYLEGETLSDRLRRGRLSSRECTDIALQICAGLAEAHRKGVIHGDLKTNNIILLTGPQNSVRPVIMDFGLARMLDPSATTASSQLLAGTPAYMAPELWKGATPAVASDIYALGVIIWELVSGLTPVDLGVTSPTLSWNERPAWKAPTGYGKWDRIVARCLRADPSDRYATADEVARALGPSRAVRWLAVLALAAVLALISGLVTYQRVTTPPETIRLALLPFSSDKMADPLSPNLLETTAKQLSDLKSDAHNKVSFIPEARVIRDRIQTPEQAGSRLDATHVLYGATHPTSTGLQVHAYLMNLHSGVNVREWTGDYHTDELKYLPAALTGFVTESLHLPLAAPATLKASARPEYEAGVSAMKQGNSETSALQHFERCVTLDPDSALSYAGLAEAQWLQYVLTADKSWLNLFTESLRRANVRNPDLPEVHCVTGLQKARRSWYEQATSEYLRAIELDPLNSDAYRRLARVYQDSNQPSEALAAYRKAVAIDPNQYRNHYQLGLFYRVRGDPQSALACFQKSVQLAPADPQPYAALGSAYVDLGNFSAAESALRRSPNFQNDAPSLYTLGLVMFYLHRDTDAIPLIQSALRLQPDHYYVWWVIFGTTLKHTGQTSESKQAYGIAIDIAETALAENPRDEVARAYVAYAWSQLGDRRRAEIELAQALEQSPSDAGARVIAICTYETLGNRTQALQLLADSPRDVIADAGRWPDLADLSRTPRFTQLLAQTKER